ncbi:MAG: AI-2E family transporter [[Eubacterium] rectale]|nr:AI-2E family transporter [Agathobacter rectalis]
MQQDKLKKTLKLAWSKGLSLFMAMAGAILLVFLLFRFDSILDQILRVCNILMPIIMGIVIAYLLNPVVEFYERHLDRSLGKFIEKKTKKKVSMRGLSIFISVIIVLAVIALLIMMVVPQIYTNISNLVYSLPEQIQNLVGKLMELAKNNEKVRNAINGFYDNIMNYITNWIKSDMLGQVSVVIDRIMGIFGTAVNCLVAFIVAIYVLLSKETFRRQIKKGINAFFNERQTNVIVSVVKESDKIFGGFISGKIIDSFIIGVICFVCCLILRMPYVALVSVIVGVTNLIPFFGPYIGAIPSAVLILLDSPSKGIVFIIFIAILQQVDGNIIGPKILGQSTGLSPFWVVFAIFLGNGLFGIVGLFIGVPLWAVVYYLIKRYVNYRIRIKEQVEAEHIQK